MSLLADFAPDRLLPTELEDAPGLWWVVSVEFAGQVVRLGEAVLEAQSDAGPVSIDGGLLTIEWEDTLDLPAGAGTDAEPPSIPVAAVFPVEVDVGELVADGHPLDGSPVEVALWIEGTSWEQRRVVLAGTVSDPSYGEPGEEVRFSADGSPGTDAAVIPDPAATVTTGVFHATMLHAPDGSLGLAYPLVIGAPGRVGTAKVGGSTAIVIDATARIALIAGHRVEATQVKIRDDDEDAWSPASVVEDQDQLGRDIATVVLPTPEFAVGRLSVLSAALLADGDTVDIGGVTLTAVPGARGVGEFTRAGTTAAVAADIAAAINDPLNNFDEICTATVSLTRVYITAAVPGTDGTVSLSVTTATADAFAVLETESVPKDSWLVDHSFSVAWMGGGGLGRLRGPGLLTPAGEVLEHLLSRTTLRVDIGRVRAAAPLLAGIEIAASIEAGTSPYDWIRAHLLPILPITLVAGPLGIYPVVWRWWATPDEATVDIDIDRDGCSRTSPVQLSGDPASSVVLSFARDLGLDQFTATATSSGVYARASELRHGPRVFPLESEVIYSPASAQRVVAGIQAARWTRRRTVSYQGPRDVIAPLSPGDLVTLTDDRIAIRSELAIVGGVAGLATAAPSVSVTLVDAPRGL